jgi:hypothetical protein
MRLPQRLTIRLKILIVTATLLLIFALANVLSIKLTKGVINELNTITDYFTPLSALTSKIDIETFEFELNLWRFLQENTLEPAQLARRITRQLELGKRLEQQFDAVAQLLDRAIKDERNQGTEGIELAHIAGRFALIRRDVKQGAHQGYFW